MITALTGLGMVGAAVLASSSRNHAKNAEARIIQTAALLRDLETARSCNARGIALIRVVSMIGVAAAEAAKAPVDPRDHGTLPRKVLLDTIEDQIEELREERNAFLALCVK